MKLNLNILKGKQGENIAQEYIKKQGMTIIETNWHYSKNAEIDIIAEDKDILVFIEVKTRSSLGFGHPFEAITKEKIQKINTAILGYLNQCNKNYRSYRFDGIAITGLQNPKIEYLKDIGQF